MMSYVPPPPPPAPPMPRLAAHLARELAHFAQHTTHYACPYCGSITPVATNCRNCGAAHTINATGKPLPGSMPTLNPGT